MLARKREVHRVLEQLHVRHALLQRALEVEVEQQREIELADAQAGDDLLRFALGERERHVGVGGPERRDRQRHQCRSRGRERGHAQAPAAQAGDRRQRGLGRVEAREDPLGVRHERVPGGGQADAAGMALHQRHPDLRLERGNLLGDGGLGVSQRLRGGGERPAGGHLAEDPESGQAQLCHA